MRNVGYGFASGFLFSHNISVPASAMEAYSASGSERVSQDSQGIEGRINPITGQFVDREAKVEIDMTDEEKEREAERLFVLFERWVFTTCLRFYTWYFTNFLIDSRKRESWILRIQLQRHFRRDGLRSCLMMLIRIDLFCSWVIFY